MQNILEIRDFTKSYASGMLKAVDGLNLTVQAGDIFGFIGHNGAGKTTTIRSVVGVIDFEGGTIHVCGHSVKDDPVAAKSNIAYIPDKPDIYEHITGIQYLNYMGDIFGVDKGVRRERIEKYAEAFEMTSALGDLISSYSHGMKQKISLIGAFLHQPKLLILDEPFIGLDPISAIRLREMITELCSQGSAVFFSSHVLVVVEKLCNKIGIIKGGKLVTVGNTDEVLGDSSLEELYVELAQEVV